MDSEAASGASHAYTVMGHGNEEPTQIYKVPKGCTLIVAAHSSEPTILRRVLNNTIKLLYPENRSIILDPLKFKKDIFELFGSVAIYTEGEEYPNYTYQLLNYFQGNEEKGINNMLIKSGFIDVTLADKKFIFEINEDLNNIKKHFTKNYTTVDYNTPLFINGKFNPVAEQMIRSFNIPQLFNNSIIMRQNDISKILEKLINYIRPKRIKYKQNTVKDFIILLTFKTFITQKKLFDMVENGKLRPGIFYNFVCRVTGKKLEDSNLLQPVSKLAPEVRGRISEAVIQRRRLLSNVFTQSKNPFKTLRKRRRKFDRRMTKKVLLRKSIHAFFRDS
jgi:hypothetical protein